MLILGVLVTYLLYSVLRDSDHLHLILQTKNEQSQNILKLVDYFSKLDTKVNSLARNLSQASLTDNTQLQATKDLDSSLEELIWIEHTTGSSGYDDFKIANVLSINQDQTFHAGTALKDQGVLVKLIEQTLTRKFSSASAYLELQGKILLLLSYPVCEQNCENSLRGMIVAAINLAKLCDQIDPVRPGTITWELYDRDQFSPARPICSYQDRLGQGTTLPVEINFSHPPLAWTIASKTSNSKQSFFPFVLLSLGLLVSTMLAMLLNKIQKQRAAILGLRARLVEQADHLELHSEHAKKIRNIRDLLNELPFFFCAFDAQDRIVEWNKSLADFTGVTKEQIIAHPESHNYLGLVSSSGEMRRVMALPNRNGEKRDVMWSKIEGQLGVSAWNWCVVGIDVTEVIRKRTMRIEAEYLKSSLIDHTAVGVWHVAPNGETLYANPALIALLGLNSSSELSGKSYHSFFSPESRKKLAEEFLKRPLGVSSTYQAELLTQHGDKKKVLVTGTPVLNSKGELESTVGIITDLSDAVK